MIDKPIYVTSPLLPSLEDFTFLLRNMGKQNADK